jgi:hypothetical protein
MGSGTCTHAVRVIHVDLNDAQGEKVRARAAGYGFRYRYSSRMKCTGLHVPLEEILASSYSRSSHVPNLRSNF